MTKKERLRLLAQIEGMADQISAVSRNLQDELNKKEGKRGRRRSSKNN